MANLGQTVFRFTGALILAAGATMVDHPRARFFASSAPAASERVVVIESGIAAREPILGVAPGKRAYSIRTSDPALTVLVRSNNRVDLLAVVDEPSAPGGRAARIIASDVRVLGVSLMHARSADSVVRTRIVTVEVDPEQVNDLASLAADGLLQVVVRGPDAAPAVVRAIRR